MAETEKNNKQNTIQKTKRNGLLELYRFLFALWVVWYHGFFIFKTEYFNHGYIAVEFFFILSGFYVLKSIEKYNEKSFWAGLWELLWSRIKALGLAFIIGLIFVVWYMFIEGQISQLGYLWYIPFMLLAFIFVYILKRLVKNKLAIILILCSTVIASYLLLYLPVLEGWGLFRGLGGVSLGVLVSFIPKKDLKIKKINLNWIITFILLGTTIYLAYLPKYNFISEYFLIFLIMPMLIYFTNTLTINSKILNFLGSLSFGLYAYQCILRVIEFYAPLQQYWFFLILVALVLLDKVIVQLYKKYKTKNAVKQNTNAS